MIDVLRHWFAEGTGYILVQENPDEIERFCRLHLYDPFHKTAKHRLWAPETAEVSRLGSLIGWLPESLSAIFFTETVQREVAVYCAAASGGAGAGREDASQAEMLLAAAGLDHLADRQPYTLSDGETKLVRLLCQLAKQPEYFIAGNPLRGLSTTGLECLMSILQTSVRTAQEAGVPAPVCILGCLPAERDRWHTLLSLPGWKIRDNPLVGKGSG